VRCGRNYSWLILYADHISDVGINPGYGGFFFVNEGDGGGLLTLDFAPVWVIIIMVSISIIITTKKL
jgi:hypothetical protein